MIFASDLDQTLMYSTRSFRLLPDEVLPPITSVERYEGRDISFMADEAIGKLQEIARQSVFVPVTTRSIEQYQRISLFQQIICPAYAVMSNGGNVMIHGVIDKKWQGIIRQKMDQLCLCPEDMLVSLQEFCHASWAQPMRMADDLFYYCIVERDRIPMDELESFTSWAKGQQWNVSLQGRKLYIVPAVVNKWAGIAYVKDFLEETVVAAAGDSLLDLCMLEQANYSIAPSHGELWDRYCRGEFTMPDTKFTKQSGIFAANDILEYVQNCIFLTSDILKYTKIALV